MYVFELLVMTACGLLFLSLGWRIWKKEQINLIHDYHHKKVSDNDKKPYTRQMGQAMLIMGAGIVLTGIIDFIFKTSAGWAVFGLTFVGGLIMMVVAQLKYNHGIF